MVHFTSAFYTCVVLLSVILLDTDENHTVASFVNDIYLHTSWDSTHSNCSTPNLAVSPSLI